MNIRELHDLCENLNFQVFWSNGTTGLVVHLPERFGSDLILIANYDIIYLPSGEFTLNEKNKILSGSRKTEDLRDYTIQQMEKRLTDMLNNYSIVYKQYILNKKIKRIKKDF